MGTVPPNISKHLRFLWIPLWYPLDTPLDNPLDTPQTCPGNNRWQQTPTETKSQPKTPQDTDGCCLSMSGSVSWHLLVSFDLWRCLGGVWGTSGGVWRVSGGYLRVSECKFWKSEALICVLGSQPLQYGAITLFWHSPERHYFFFHFTIVGYMISLFFSARQKDIKNGSCKWSPCSCFRRIKVI